MRRHVNLLRPETVVQVSIQNRPAEDGRSDEELALAFQNGDQAAYDILVRRLQNMVYAVAYRMTGRREDALDIAQESFLKAYRKMGTWKPTGKFSSWMLRLTSNQAIDHLRRAGARRKREVTVEATQLFDTGIVRSLKDRAESDATSHEIEDRVQAAMTVLSPAQRLVFVLRHYEGRPLAEIAPVLGCSVGSVKVHLFRALKKLRIELRDLVE